MTASYYERLGGDAAIVRLVDAFYDRMDVAPEAAAIRAMHPADLTESRAKLVLFLRMWTGGPQDYLAERGHPRLRARHLPFPIDDAAAAAWVTCMVDAMADTVADAALRDELGDAFFRVAAHMRNRA